MEMKELTKLIKSIKTRSTSLREDIHVALKGCAFHAMIHRNTTPFDQLFEAVGNGTRKEGMLKWASIYAPVHFKDGKVVLSDKRQKDYDGTPEEYLIELGQSARWFEIAKPEPVANPWDSGEFLSKVVKYMADAVAKAKKNDSVLAEELAALEFAARTLETKVKGEYVVAEVE